MSCKIEQDKPIKSYKDAKKIKVFIDDELVHDVDLRLGSWSISESPIKREMMEGADMFTWNIIIEFKKTL